MEDNSNMMSSPGLYSFAINGKQYNFARAWHNLLPSDLAQQMVARGEGKLTDSGAIACRTGSFTGRSPQDRVIVKDASTENTIDWGDINIPSTNEVFNPLADKLISQLQEKEVFIKDCYACSAPECRLNIRVISSTAYHSLFADNMFLRLRDEPDATEQQDTRNISPDVTIIVDPSFKADAQVDGTRSPNFVIMNIAAGVICIGGTGYTGEVKKGVFSLLNYLLPQRHQTLGMHCGANIGKDGKVALFFGLSGTGKTTLSSDPKRQLIGDDEHGWSEQGIFNMEGGCYAKVINLSHENEPLIWDAIKPGALLENVSFCKDSNKVDYSVSAITENTRVSYPLSHIDNFYSKERAPHPSDIFFLSCDSFGILPPLASLTEEQAAFYFLCGYTAKIAGTEQGITEPKAALSVCFGAPFMPLPPLVYANMMQEKTRKYGVKIWLVNTGWSGGGYGEGSRMPLKYTRALIDAVLEKKLPQDKFASHPVFDFAVPQECPEVPSEILNPQDTWQDKEAYFKKAKELKQQLEDFVSNYN